VELFYDSLNSELDDIICYKSLSKDFSCTSLHAIISVHIVSFFLLHMYLYVHDYNGIETGRQRDGHARISHKHGFEGINSKVKNRFVYAGTATRCFK